jgi:hypothetical protein
MCEVVADRSRRDPEDDLQDEEDDDIYFALSILACCPTY